MENREKDIKNKFLLDRCVNGKSTILKINAQHLVKPGISE